MVQPPHDEVRLATPTGFEELAPPTLDAQLRALAREVIAGIHAAQ